MFPYICLFIVLRSLKIGPSGVFEFGNKILTVKHVVGLLRKGIGPLTTKAQHTQHSKEKKVGMQGDRKDTGHSMLLPPLSSDF